MGSVKKEDILVKIHVTDFEILLSEIEHIHDN